jgi:putative ABC transport system permease protein
MKSLDKKLLRDIQKLWAQALAIALVIAAGAATLVLGVGSYRSLDETRAAYYERYRFGDIFATVKRAPNGLRERILAIPGVAAAQTRVSEFALLDIEGMAEPATGIALSVPDHSESVLNRQYIRSGRFPEPGNPDEVTVNESFALAHRFTIGSTFKAVLNGKKRPLTVVGIALSPEFVYAVGPGDVIPDPRRFGILWMSEKALAALYDLEGAFNSVSLKLLRNANSAEVIKQLDDILAPFGGTGAYERKDQSSHAFLDAELKGLSAMSKVTPPIFLLVSAFLINMILSRLIALEREQIGLLKAIGYGRVPIASHYIKLVLIISAVGGLIGCAAGTWLGHGMTILYAEFYHFPFLIFRSSIDLYAIAIIISVASAVLGAVRAVVGALMLPPAVAMSPPAPTQYAHMGVERLARLKIFTHLTMMALRHIVRWPVRTGLTILGIGLSGAVLLMALFSLDSVNFMIDSIFFRADRQDATLSFVNEQPSRVVEAVQQLPGVLAVEPYRSVSVRLHNGHRNRKLAITGKPPDTDLSRVLDLDLNPVTLPASGLVLSERVAELLGAKRGDWLDVEVLEDKRGVKRVHVSEINQSYLGMTVFMNLRALNEMLDEGRMVSGTHISFDAAERDRLFSRIKELPAVSGIAIQEASLVKFRDTVAKNIHIMTSVYIGLALIISFGVVYNSARIQLSERVREFASLRVLGFTRGEVSHVLLMELGLLVVAAIPIGGVIGYGFAWAVINGFRNDVYRVPFVVDLETYAVSAIVVMVSAAISALIVRRRIDRLDMISALKTRE